MAMMHIVMNAIQAIILMELGIVVIWITAKIVQLAQQLVVLVVQGYLHLLAFHALEIAKNVQGLRMFALNVMIIICLLIIQQLDVIVLLCFMILIHLPLLHHAVHVILIALVAVKLMNAILA